MKSFLEHSKRGVASLYVVIFATILFGVITLSFIRLTVSELSQTNDSDLSQSAYDAALAGVEDAKILVSRYYTNKLKGISGLEEKDVFSNGDNKDCFVLSRLLYGEENGEEVSIQENEGEADESNTNSANQAYTCVTLSNITKDYKFTLGPNSRVHIVPLAVDNDAENFANVEFYWYTEKNGTKIAPYTDPGMALFPTKDNETIPPTIPPAITLGIIAVGGTVNVDALSARDEKNFATVALVPSDSKLTDATNDISAENLEVAGNIDKENEPYKIKCYEPGQTQEYACVVIIDVEKFKSDQYTTDAEGNKLGNVYLVASMPYGAVETDCKVVKKKEGGTVDPFKDVQVEVDSTGRAADLYRRVQVRLSPATANFPFPQFELDLSGPDQGGNNGLDKAMWVTKNCWGTGCKNSNSNKD